MYLIGSEITVNWTLEPAEEPIPLSSLDIYVTEPNGLVQYTNAAIAAERYVAPTDTAFGMVSYLFYPDALGLWLVTLTDGTELENTIWYEYKLQIDTNDIYTRKFVPGPFSLPDVIPAYDVDVLADNPMAYWKLNEASGNALDSSGNGRHCSVVGDITRLQPGLISEGTSYLWGGDDTGIVKSTDPVFRALTDLTVEIWFNPIAYQGWVIAQQQIPEGAPENSANNFQWSIIVGASGTITLFHEYGAGTDIVVTTAANPVGLNAPNHIVAVRDIVAKTWKIYHNGAFLETLNYVTNPDGGQNTELWIGNHDTPGSEINARADQVAIYNYKVPSSRILSHYIAARI